VPRKRSVRRARRRSGKTRNGSKWLEEAAMAALRAKDNYLAAQ
jgi:hypothetical protein